MKYFMAPPPAEQSKLLRDESSSTMMTLYIYSVAKNGDKIPFYGFDVLCGRHLRLSEERIGSNVGRSRRYGSNNLQY
jgi:hypothetical protein